MDEKKTVVETEEARIELDFDKITEWRQEGENNFPVYSFLSFYKACGIEPYLKEYSEKNDGKQIIAVENILCNFYTLQRIKNFIENTWKTYSLDIKSDNNVYWKPTSKYGREKHYPQSLSKKIKASLIQDLGSYGCGIDDELVDNVIVFRTYKEEDLVENVNEDLN